MISIVSIRSNFIDPINIKYITLSFFFEKKNSTTYE